MRILRIVLGTVVFVATAQLADAAGFGLAASYGIAFLVQSAAWGMVFTTLWEDDDR